MITKELKEITILFAGDSGDGMQLTGSQFTNTAALVGNDIATFPDFPAEIRAPGGTLAGVSGFKLHFGSISIHSPGDLCDVLVVMNAAALKKNIQQLKPKGIIIANTAGFDNKNLKLAHCNSNPLLDLEEDYQIHSIDILKQTNQVLNNHQLSPKIKSRTKNMFALGFVYWLYSRPLDYTKQFLANKFGTESAVYKANLEVLKAGYQYGEITDTFTERYTVAKANMPKGKYRNISGNHALTLGLISASKQAKLDLFYSGYPITPASDILHHLSKYKQHGVKTFQAEDEIAAITAVIGASFAGNLAVTASSGPGIALKIEALGLAIMLELPAVVINVQRGGPSTGLPTKTEQADLMQAFYARNGEAPMPVVAAKSPSDCFDMALWAAKLAIEHMTPVMLLSDGYLANGAEPWNVPKQENLLSIQPNFASNSEQEYLPYQRNNHLVRQWAIPGTKGLEHRVGGLEKDFLTGNVSYDADNHELMVKTRQQKIDKIQAFIPNIKIESSHQNANTLLLTWGSTYGAVCSAMEQLLAQDYTVAHAHLQFLNPFPKNLQHILNQYDTIVVPELNNGQLSTIIQSTFLKKVVSFTKIQGQPFSAKEVAEKVVSVLSATNNKSNSTQSKP